MKALIKCLMVSTFVCVPVLSSHAVFKCTDEEGLASTRTSHVVRFSLQVQNPEARNELGNISFAVTTPTRTFVLGKPQLSNPLAERISIGTSRNGEHALPADVTKFSLMLSYTHPLTQKLHTEWVLGEPIFLKIEDGKRLEAVRIELCSNNPSSSCQSPVRASIEGIRYNSQLMPNELYYHILGERLAPEGTFSNDSAIRKRVMPGIGYDDVLAQAGVSRTSLYLMATEDDGRRRGKRARTQAIKLSDVQKITLRAYVLEAASLHNKTLPVSPKDALELATTFRHAGLYPATLIINAASYISRITADQ